MCFAVDTAGTFADLLVEDDGDKLLLHKPTTPDDPIQGVIHSIDIPSCRTRSGASRFWWKPRSWRVPRSPNRPSPPS